MVVGKTPARGVINLFVPGDALSKFISITLAAGLALTIRVIDFKSLANKILDSELSFAWFNSNVDSISWSFLQA